MTYIMAISKATKNVLTVTNPNDFIFHSSYNTLKYDTQGSMVATIDFSNYYYSEYSDFFGITIYYNRKVVSVSHNLGYVPYFAGYVVRSASPLTMVQLPLEFADAWYFVSYNIYADSSKIYFVVMFNSFTNSGSDNVTLYYRIFKNSLGL